MFKYKAILKSGKEIQIEVTRRLNLDDMLNSMDKWRVPGRIDYITGEDFMIVRDEIASMELIKPTMEETNEEE